MRSEKKQYATPRLIVHGDVEAITRNSTAFNCDAPCGANNNNAYAPPS
jgi:hypothetical protein